MSERKVLSKYYPPEFDPSKITRTPKHLKAPPKLMTVRLMAPYSMKCTSCGEYIYKGRKFNARKETTDEKYLNIPVYRFYIRCTRCSSEITFKTDPKNMDYTCERGAQRNFEAWRDPASKELQETDEQRLDRLQREQAEAEEQEALDAMEELEQKREDAQREMQVNESLDQIRLRNARIERGEKEEAALAQVAEALQRQTREQEEDEEAVRKAFEEKRARLAQKAFVEGEKVVEKEDEDERNGSTASASVPTFERVKKIRKAPLVTVKAASTQPQSQISSSSSGLGLAAYDSD